MGLRAESFKGDVKKMSKILVIDDEKNTRKMVRLTLERDGHETEGAEDGPRGLELFGDGAKWDLVLTDQRMTGMEGQAVTREVRRRDPAARLVMMTAFATSELASEVLADGALDFLRKPFSADVLRGAVSAALARPRRENVAISDEPETIRDGPLAGLRPRPAGIPPISFYLNGFAFWPVKATEGERQTMQNLNTYRVFQVRGPSYQTGRCIVGMTPHVEELVRAQSKRPDDDFLWEMVCRESLTNYLWEKAEMPPAMLPIYELTSRQLDDVRRLAQGDDEE